MKKLDLLVIILVSAILLPGCEAIGGIFKAGMWVGVIVVVIVVAIVLWLIGKVRK